MCKHFIDSAGKVTLKKGSNGVANATLKCQKGGMAITERCEEGCNMMVATITVEKIGKGVGCVGVCGADAAVHLPPQTGMWCFQSNGFVCNDGKLAKCGGGEWQNGDILKLEYSHVKGVLSSSRNGGKAMMIKGIDGEAAKHVCVASRSDGASGWGFHIAHS